MLKQEINDSSSSMTIPSMTTGLLDFKNTTLEKTDEQVASPKQVQIDLLVKDSDPATDKFLQDTYEKLRQLEEEIQKRKQSEVILLSQRKEALTRLEEKVAKKAQNGRNESNERGRVQFSFEDSPSPINGKASKVKQNEDDKKQVRFKRSDSARSKSRPSSGTRSATANSNQITPRAKKNQISNLSK